MLNEVTFANALDTFLRMFIPQYRESALKEDLDNSLVISETIGEVIEKLLILNIRIWVLEDLAAKAKKEGDDKEYAELKKKLDFSFKVKRPMLISALNKMFRSLVIGNNLSICVDHNIKVYQNEEKDENKNSSAK